MGLAQKRTLTAEEDVPRNPAYGLTSLSHRLARLVLERRPQVVWAVALFPLLFVVLMAIGKLLTTLVSILDR
ncbi:MAG: hypothetical protein K0R41_3832 [Geminicoccaceae bacterium]|jgi:hypothetical protein|nr:hypothetical protein [Geminicoccaceae bacterium]